MNRITQKLQGNLIANFSRKGKNYVSGSIVGLSMGNTEVIANMIQKMLENL